MKQKVKKSTVKTFKHTVWREFSKYIRLRDCIKTTGSPYFGLCITCGKSFDILHLDAGHFIPGRHNQNLFDETGCHAQCKGCNLQQSHGGSQILAYRRKIIEMYGEGYDEELERRNQIRKKFTIEELQELLTSIKNKILLLEKGIYD